MTEIIEIATNVSTPLALGGLVAAIFFFILRKIVAKNIFPKLTKSLGAGILKLIIERLFVLALVAMVLGFAGYVIDIAFGGVPASYRVRVTVLDTEGQPVEDAEVWLSVGGEEKGVSGGKEFVIPREIAPKDGKVTAFASRSNAFLKGQREFVFGEDYNPTITVQLERDTSATIRGMVVDASGRGVSGVRVSVVGHGSEAVTTGADGSFELAAHAAPGQQVQLHAEKDSIEPVSQWHPAGETPATLTLRANK